MPPTFHISRGHQIVGNGICDFFLDALSGSCCSRDVCGVFGKGVLCLLATAPSADTSVNDMQKFASGNTDAARGRGNSSDDQVHQAFHGPNGRHHNSVDL